MNASLVQENNQILNTVGLEETRGEPLTPAPAPAPVTLRRHWWQRCARPCPRPWSAPLPRHRQVPGTEAVALPPGPVISCRPPDTRCWHVRPPVVTVPDRGLPEPEPESGSGGHVIVLAAAVAGPCRALAPRAAGTSNREPLAPAAVAAVDTRSESRSCW